MVPERLEQATMEKVECIFSYRNGLYKGRLVQSMAGGVLVDVEEGVLLTGESLFLWFSVHGQYCLYAAQVMRVDVALQDRTVRGVQLGFLQSLSVSQDSGLQLGVVVGETLQEHLSCKMARLALKEFSFALAPETKVLFGLSGKVQFVVQFAEFSVHLHCEVQQRLVLPSFVLYKTSIQGTSDVGLLREAIQRLRGG